MRSGRTHSHAAPFGFVFAAGLFAAVVAPAVVGSTAARAQSLDYAAVAARVLPAVVDVEITRAIAAPPGAEPDGTAAPRAPTGRVNRGLGSGFVIDAAGLIVTNRHVIADADAITVSTRAGERYAATLVGADLLTDLAVLRIEPERRLTAVRWGRSDTARIGQPVIAVGAPFGLGGTVTSGIISGIDRQIRNNSDASFDAFIQTDAAINSGNSGGPLLNADGQVLGVNTTILTTSGGNVGIGFAIPQTIAEAVVDDLIAFGRVRRGTIGAEFRSLRPDERARLQAQGGEGAVVMAVAENSPAAQAGLRAGDVVVAMGEDSVSKAQDMTALVAGTDIGVEVPVIVVRDGRQVTVKVTIADAAQD